ncbi:hypothetical protein M8C21_011632 [Ambrosia artemisiifolia]|uniref:PGG domain-containing protein n=1 Tax=Ambrosia artemisiifolia TaxID=4212 RepID=A0AAD5G8C5_AMBAR|nr:hypothetical protein M8C21_011632 [Ambrosia artemisiifolia]
METANSSNTQYVSTVDIIQHAVFALRDDLQYIQVSDVNVSSFVTVKLSGPNNYLIWKAQIMCLIESQGLLHLLEEPGDGEDILIKYDDLVKGWIFSSMNETVLKYFVYFFPAHNLWREIESSFMPLLRDTAVVTSPGFKFGTEFLRVPETQDTDNIRLKKELYEATVEGCWWKVKAILKINKNAATEPITPNGNTILHLAVEMGHNYFVEQLLDFFKDGNDIEKTNNKGRTALHIAVLAGNNYAAQLLVQKRSNLLVILDHHGHSPLYTAFSNFKFDISADLLQSMLSSDLTHYPDDYQRNVTFAILAAIYGKKYDVAESLLENFPECARETNHILETITRNFPAGPSFMESFIYPSFNNLRQKVVVRCSVLFHYNIFDKIVDDILRVVRTFPVATLYPIYQLICLLIMVLHLTSAMLYFRLWKVLAVTVPWIKNIEAKKKEHKEAKKILSLICSQMGTSKDDYRSSIQEAVCQGTYEVVDEILFRSPDAINCKTEEGHNIIQLAIMYRSEKVYNLIHHIMVRMYSSVKMLDSCQNTLLHLAGRLAPSFVLGRTTGAALQLQLELLWIEEVKKLMLPIEVTNENIYKETAAMVFTREHKDLMKQGESWMKTTAESCSITAALIVTVVFAAAITVPGGSIQESGIPLFRKEIAFTVFAISNAFSLFTAAASLLLFLSILTARFSESDFLVSLPRRLIFGLLTLFLSTTSMIVAFGAILFLVFCDQRPWMLAPIFGFACLPISVIVTIKLPLLVDLIKSTYFPIFGKQRYLETCKINRKNTIFEEE